MSSELYVKAKGYALRLFKLRPRSTKELVEKLRGKGYEQIVIDRLVSDLIAWNMLDDQAFARAWYSGRIKRYGHRRIARELAEKGIDKETIQALREEGREDYDEESVIREIAEKRLRHDEDVPPQKRKRRLMEYLARRGFSLELIGKVIRTLR